MKKIERTAERKQIQKQLMWYLIMGDLYYGFRPAMYILIPLMLFLGFVRGEPWGEMLLMSLAIPVLSLTGIGLDVWFYRTDFHYPRYTYEKFGLPDPDDLADGEAKEKG